MGLLDYETRFSQLRMNTRDGEKSPHKVVMLLAVIDLFEDGKITENKIYFNKALKQRFTHHFSSLAGSNQRDNPHLPFFHLRSSGFWEHYIRPGKSASYKELKKVGGASVIDEHIQYVFLDDELFELLGNSVVRRILKEALYRNLDDQIRFNILGDVKGWNWLECELVVDLYFKMLHSQASGEKFVKTRLYSELVPKLNNRNIGAVENKCQNISAIMTEFGCPYVIGLKPRPKYQQQLLKVVRSKLVGHGKLLESVIEESLVVPDEIQREIDWASVSDTEIPHFDKNLKETQPTYVGRHTNYAQREFNNRTLGLRGEEFVLDFEKYRMRESERYDLVNDVEWSSKVRGDGLGYDIRSFNPINDEELFIEVKTTNSGKYQPFFISDNEVSYSKDFSDQYTLYRVFQFRTDPKLFQLDGDIEKYVHLKSKNYIAKFS